MRIKRDAGVHRDVIDNARPRQAAAPQRISVMAFTGEPGVGKATAARAVADRCGHVLLAFGDAVRSEISAAWSVDRDVLTRRSTLGRSMLELAIGKCKDPAFVAWCYAAGESFQEPRSPRCVMQQWASFRRRYRPSHYAAIVARKIIHHASAGSRSIVISDLQDPIEASFLRGLGVLLTVVRVHRPQVSELDSTATRGGRPPHLIADFDIHNDGSIDALRDAVLRLPTLCRSGV